MTLNTKRFSVLLLALLMALASVSALASGSEEVPSIAFEADITATEEPKVPDTYSVWLKAVTEGAPMPEGTEGGVYTLTRTGPGSVVFPELTFEEYGVYAYQMGQNDGSHPSATAYDDTVYTVTVYRPRTGRFSVVIKNGEGQKVAAVKFDNTYAETSVTARKVWDDEDNQDGKRLDVTLTLTGTYTDGTGIPQTVKLPVDPDQEIAYDAAGEDLSVKWESLPEYCGGYPVTYTVSEKGAVTKDGETVIVMKDGVEYTVRIEGDAENGFTVTNSHTPEEVESAVMKVWNDGNNQDGIRPDKLMAFLSDGRAVILTEDNGWYFVVTGLPKYEHGEEIEYFWTEDVDIPGYELTGVDKVGSLTIFTNTHPTYKTAATVRKVWIDGEDQDVIRPESLTVTLSDDQEDTEDWTVVLSESNLWTATLEGLEEYADGKKIVYTWTEEDVDEYELTSTETQGIVTVLTNTHITETVDVEVEKIWVDGENENDTRPESITVTLSNGTVVTLNEENDWKARLEGLPKYDHSRTPIEYTWTEAAIAGYDLAANVTEGLVTAITNRIHDPENIEVSGTKTWIDGGKEHDNAEEITLTLERTANGKTETVDATPVWTGNTYKYTGLDKYDDDGYEYTYTVTEAQVAGYDAPEMDGYDVTNRLHDPEDVEIGGKKTWIDGGKEHNNAEEITLTLERTANDKTETVDAAPVWTGNTYKYTGLDKYDADGYEYTYTVTETQVAGYDEPEMDGYDVTNRLHDPEDVEIEGKKTWIDGGKEHDNAGEITLTLERTANGKTETVDAAPVWTGNTYKYTGLDKYDADGYEYTYTVTETQVAGYDAPEQTGNSFINRLHDPEDVEIEGEKTWIDGGKEHNNAEEITLTLYRTANGKTEEVDAAPVWTGNSYKYTGLDRYDPDGYEYTYTVAEAQVAGYDPPEIAGFDVTNRLHDPENVEIGGTKTWIDGGKEHDNAEEITLTLYRTANGKTETVDAAPVWTGNTYKYTGLDKYDADGYEYTYTVTENRIAGYDEPEQTGNSFTNRIHDPENIEITGTKTWIDGGKEHDNAKEIVLTLKRTANGKTETVDVKPVWTGNTYKYTGLDKYDADGYLYIYTVTETQVSGYDTPEQDGFDYTNRIHDPENIEVSGTKTWIDGGKEHDNAEEIVLTLYRTANGNTETVDAKPVWIGNVYRFGNLDKYDADGYEYTYTVTETQVEGYDAPEQNGYNVTNRIHDPEDVEIEGEKTWIDGGKEHNNAEEITLKLYRTANGKTEEVDAKPVWTGNTYKFTGLDKYDADGYEYTYTVTETQVAGYDAPEMDGFDVTNRIHDPENIEISGRKTWIDGGKEHDNAEEIVLTLERTANGKTETVDAVPVWTGNTYKYTGLDKYDPDGYEYTYTVTETQVAGYDASEQTGNSFINRLHDPEDVEIGGEKTWIDGGKEHDNAEEITLKLYRIANGKTEEVDAKPVWTGNSYKFTGLDKYDEDGYEYIYTVIESRVDGYDAPEQTGNSFTNRITQKYLNLSVRKAWEDVNDLAGLRPDSLTVALLANGEEVKRVTLDGKNGWSARAEKLPMYDEDGKAIVYTWEEKDLPDEYEHVLPDEVTEDGLTVITNRYEPEMIRLKVTKVWIDSDNREGFRPDSVTLILYANGKPYAPAYTVTLTAEDNWTKVTEDTFPRMIGGRNAEYAWVENPIPAQYEFDNDYEVKEEHDEDGTLILAMTVTNTNAIDYAVVSIQKSWAGDQAFKDLMRPDSVTVRLMRGVKGADGEITGAELVKEIVLTESGSWYWKSGDRELPRFEDGHEIVYWFEETEVTGYTPRPIGDPQEIVMPGKPVEYRFRLTNDLDTMDLVVRKVWNDRHYRGRPSTLTVTLTGTVGRNTVVQQNYTLRTNGEDTWELTVPVPKYDTEGNEIKYSWTERVPTGYRLEKKDTNGNVTTFTNKKTSGGGGTPAYTLTIYYVYEDGTTAAETYVHQYRAGDPYSVISPHIPGYTASIPVVQGVMPAHDVTVTVVYVRGDKPPQDDGGPGFGPIWINEGDCLE